MTLDDSHERDEVILHATRVLMDRFSCSANEAATRLQMAADGGEGHSVAEVAAEIMSDPY